MDDKKNSYKDNFESRFQDYKDEENRNKAFEWLKQNLYKSPETKYNQIQLRF